MCVINISLNPTTPAGTTITNRNGRYRKVGTTTWTNFTMPSNSYALNVNDLGQYQLEVNVTNSLGVVSSWAPSSFDVTNTCGDTGDFTLYRIQGGANFDETYSYINTDNNLVNDFIDGFATTEVCAVTGSVSAEATVTVTALGPCSGSDTLTTTTSPATETDCMRWKVTPNLPSGFDIEVDYINCDGELIFLVVNGSNGREFCAREVRRILIVSQEWTGNFTSGNFSGSFGRVESLNITC